MCFVFVGPQTRQSEAVFGSLKDKRVHQLGEIALAAETAAYAGCELFCMPSTQESFGGVYAEAWAFGKPVIGGRVFAITCVIDDGKDGFLCSQDPGELAEKICYLIEHPELATAMGEAGRRKVQERLTWAQLAETTLNVYKDLL